MGLTDATRTSIGTAFRDDILYPLKLNEDEMLWRDRYHWFKDTHRLTLRPRYHPDWTPSWLVTGENPSYCEDAIQQILYMILDAKDDSGTVVCLKLIHKEPDEVAIAQYLSSLQNEHNHTVPFIKAFKDNILPSDIEYMVMPVMRPYDDPEFWAVGEVVEFITQLLEGLNFMHEACVAHGDLTGPNIMMDGKPLYPGGWHFVADHYSSDGRYHLTPLARIDHPVRYYIVDYGHSVRLPPGQPCLITGRLGRDRDAPERATRQPYDPFKLDVFTTGNVFFKDFYQIYLGLEFLKPLVDNMMLPDPHKRPTARASLDQWYAIKASLNVSMAHWRLRKPKETMGERVVLNTVAAAQQGIHSLKHLFYNSQTRSWSNP